MSLPQTVFLFNKANEFGLRQDVQFLQESLKFVCGKVKVSDPLEPPVLCDLAVHFEVPYYGWMPWARRNVLLVNPEWWEDAWAYTLPRFQALVFKCEEDRKRFLEKLGAAQAPAQAPATYVLPWATPLTQSAFAALPKSDDPATSGFLWLLGASRNKREAAEKILPLWKSSWPSLRVYTTTPLEISPLSENVQVIVTDLPEQTRRELQAFYPVHLIFSAAEAACLAALEGEAAGAVLFGNSLPVYKEQFTDSLLTPATLVPFKGGVKDTFEWLTSEALETAVNKCIDAVRSDPARKQQIGSAVRRAARSKAEALAIFQTILKSKESPPVPLKALPPILESPNDCPPISIITLLHNRRKFVDLCLHNLLITDYPKDKIEWVVVEDSDKTEEQAADKVIKFGREAAPMSVTYIPVEKKNVPIGAMRNRAIKKAQHDIILFMDDDDHYPPTSIRRRVAWLTRHPWKPKAVTCTTIACYDLLKGTSAVNTPPWSLGLKERVSEATFAFYKSWWEEKKFPKVNMSEGEGFLEGREGDVLEIPPQQSIVAMSHGNNASSRRIPAGPSGKPSCFWGFPKEFLIFLHRLVGVEIEEINS